MMEDSNKPKFSADIAYLERIGWLMQACHTAAGDEDASSYLIPVRQLHLEVYPRLDTVTKKKDDDKDDSQKKKCLDYETAAIKAVRGGDPQAYDKVRAYHLIVNGFAHSNGLIMNNVNNISAALDE